MTLFEQAMGYTHDQLYRMFIKTVIFGTAQTSWSSLYAHYMLIVGTLVSLPWLSEPRLLTDNTWDCGLLRRILRFEKALTKKLLQEAERVVPSVSKSSFKFAASHFRTLSSGL